MDFTVMAYGDRALLVEFDEASSVIRFRDSVRLQGHRGIRSVVPAARTVLVEFDPALVERAELTALLRTCARAPAAPAAVTGEPTELAVYYDGADLAAVAEESGMSVESVIGRHISAEYTVQFCGFSPGFGYLTGLDPALRLPRLASPRAAVPAGSVAIADEYTGVYPRSSPGGWRLLGRTDANLFGLDRTPPALLTPGSRVRLVRQ
ncbi:MAG: allophanate hydrolase subunit 1 [Actinomycetota bacterium]|nr:allophanate hydrolase subunit 1 [Actinomycetota bacterium]MDQ2956205.1 allophanate hydrolase subunit 1 [Actinomycetota bacterium]